MVYRVDPEEIWNGTFDENKVEEDVGGLYPCMPYKTTLDEKWHLDIDLTVSVNINAGIANAVDMKH